jgi:hypothetical protein
MPDRTKPTLVRWTPDEHAAVLSRATTCRLPFASYVRACALGAVPTTPRNAYTQAILRELGRSGDNLNHLAREAHALDLFPVQERIEAALALHLSAIQRLVEESGA